MAQKTFVDGDVLAASDINKYLAGEGGAWTSYTTQIDQGASTNIAKTTDYSKYGRWGRMIVWNFALTLSASGTAGSGFTLTLPVTAVSAFAGSGSGQIYDTSTATRYSATLQMSTTTTVSFVGDWSGNAAWGATPNLALASGDLIRGSITYEAAS